MLPLRIRARAESVIPLVTRGIQPFSYTNIYIVPGYLNSLSWYLLDIIVIRHTQPCCFLEPLEKPIVVLRLLGVLFFRVLTHNPSDH